MKKRKILVLIPALGLLLTGCSIQEGIGTAKSWVSQNIYHPLKDFIKSIMGKGEKKEDPTPEPTPTPTPTPSGDVAVTGVTVTPATLNLKTNSEDVTLTVTIAPENATNKAVTWSVAPEGVVSVQDGKVHVVGVGTAVVTATSAADSTKSGSCTVTVTEYVPGGNDGSAEHPYTVSEARAAAKAEVTADVHVAGIIYKVDSYNTTYKSLTYWISEDGTGDTTKKDGLQIYSGKGLEGADFTGKGDLLVGDEVVVKGDLKIHNETTYELDKNNVLISKTTPTVTDIAISGTPQTEYTEGVKYNNSGLVVTATLSNGVSADVTEFATWTYNGKESAVAALTDETVKIAATYAEITKSIDVSVTVSAPSSETSTVTIDYDHRGAITTGTSGSKQTYESEDGKLTVVISNGVANETNKDIRVYKGATITFTAAAEVQSIAFTCSAENGAENFADLEGFVKAAPNGTWTGNMKTVTFTASAKQVRMTSIVVIYK